MTDEFFKQLYALRGIRNPCPRCRGLGTLYYGNGGTWRKNPGMVTQGFVHDTCDECWGSGDADRHWLDLNANTDTLDERVAKMAGDYWRQASGCYGRENSAVREIIDELEKLANPRARKKRAPWFREHVGHLVEYLRKAMPETKP